MNTKEGYIYVIDFGDGKTFKIGFTTIDVANRLSQLSKSCVLMPNKMSLVMSFEVTTNAYVVENLMHMKFDGYRIRGEWFELGFVELVELYQTMLGLSVRKTLYDRWFEIVPADHKEYASQSAISEVPLPYMVQEDYFAHLEDIADLSKIFNKGVFDEL